MPQRIVQHFKKHYKTYATGLSYGAQALQLASKVAALINVEKKWKDSGVAGNVLSATAQVDWLTDLAKGTGGNDRVGNSVMLKNAFMRFKLQAHPSATAPTNARIMIVIDKDSNGGTAPTSGDVLASLAPSMLAFNNMNNKDRFKIIFDKCYTVDNTAGIAGFVKSKYFTFGFMDKKQRPPKPVEHHLTWSNSGTASEKGHIYIIYWTDATSNQPTFNYNWRMRFIDN